jgi:CelD/BcsL family acetyltransferase involved in cellulose biosynthesis
VLSNKLTNASNDLHVAVVHSEEEFDALKNDWDELVDNSNQCVYFLRWSWNRLWWKAYAPLEGQLYLIVCRDQSGQLLGLAPLYWRRASTPTIPSLKELLFLGTGIPIISSEHLDLITRRGYEQQVCEAMAAKVLQDRSVDRLWLSEIPITSIALPHFRRAIGEQHHLAICNRSHYVDTRITWNEFNASLGKSTRAKLARCTRRLYSLGSCEFHCVKTSDELEPAMNHLVQLHQARWRSKGEPGSFAMKSFEKFLKEAMQSTLADGRLRLWTLSLNGETAAALLAFLDNGVAHYFQGGFDPKYAKDSLGTAMFGLCIRACIETESIRQFNFMGGDAAYKAHWTELGVDSVALDWLRPGVRSSLVRIYETSELAGKSLWRTVVPQTIQAARRRRKRRK